MMMEPCPFESSAVNILDSRTIFRLDVEFYAGITLQKALYKVHVLWGYQ